MKTFAAGFAAGIAFLIVAACAVLAYAEAKYTVRREHLLRDRARTRARHQ